jgi:hypothetical protein
MGDEVELVADASLRLLAHAVKVAPSRMAVVSRSRGIAQFFAAGCEGA